MLFAKIYKGHTVAYGTFVGTSKELKWVYYNYGYKDDFMLPPEHLLDFFIHAQDNFTKCLVQGLHEKQLASVMADLLDTLTPRERRILCMRFGIGLKQNYTCVEIGQKWGVSRERVRQIEMRALRKMKAEPRITALKPFIETYKMRR